MRGPSIPPHGCIARAVLTVPGCSLQKRLFVFQNPPQQSCPLRSLLQLPVKEPLPLHVPIAFSHASLLAFTAHEPPHTLANTPFPFYACLLLLSTCLRLLFYIFHCFVLFLGCLSLPRPCVPSVLRAEPSTLKMFGRAVLNEGTQVLFICCCMSVAFTNAESFWSSVPS